jgi:hypothetical protein
VQAHCDPVVYTYWTRVWDRLTASSKDTSSAHSFGSREAARRKMRRLTGVSAGASAVGARYGSIADLAVHLANSNPNPHPEPNPDPDPDPDPNPNPNVTLTLNLNQP